MITIAWDIDDVLNELMREWFSWWKGAHADCGFSYEEISCNPPHELLGVSLNEYLESLDQFRIEKYSSLLPNEDVLGWFKKTGINAHHIVLSAVPADCAHISAQWVMKHFGHWIRGFHYIPSGRNEKEAAIYDKTKADFLKRTGFVDIFIDDSEKNIVQASEVGMKTYLVNKSWNAGGEPLSGILEKVTKDILF